MNSDQLEITRSMSILHILQHISNSERKLFSSILVRVLVITFNQKNTLLDAYGLTSERMHQRKEIYINKYISKNKSVHII
jgi:hypothetical protein